MMLNSIMMGLCLLLISCGGGGGIDGTGGPGSTIIARGSIDGFGSIIVNGVKYETNEASFFVDDQVAKQSDLAVGHVVKLEGFINEDQVTGRAEKVVFFSNVIGSIKSIDVIEAKLVVLGQTILIDEQTLINEGNSIVSLDTGQIIKVSGFENSKQQIVATRLDTVTTSNYQVVGKVSNLDTSAQKFNINGLPVDYNNNSQLIGNLELGATVKVNGEENSEGVFIANTLKLVALELDNTKSLIDLEGVVTNFIDVSSFSVNGVEVLTDEKTQYENGIANDIDLNARLQVKAMFNNDGVLVADKVIIIHSGPVVIKGSINKGEKLTYTMMSTDKDIGIWSSLKKLSETAPNNILSFTVSSSQNTANTPECISWVGTDNSRNCFADNTKATTWYLTITYSKNMVSTGEIAFELSSYFRRLPIAEPNVVADAEKIEDTLFDGDRRVYRLPAGPEGSFSIITINSSKKDFFLYAKADEYPIKTRWNRPCYIQGAFVGEKVCRLSNDGVTDWYIIVEAAGQINYSIDILEVTPTVLTNGIEVNASINTTAGNMYQLDVGSDVKTLASILSNMSESVNMSIGTDINDQQYRCVTRSSQAIDKQCVKMNDGINRWYIVTTGAIGAKYTLRSFTQNQEPEIKSLKAGESDTRTHNAGERTVYKIPAGEKDTVLTATISNATASFDLHINNDEVKGMYSSDCYHSDMTLLNKECRILNKDNVTDWYVVVEGVYSGSYTLNLEYQKIYELEEDIAVSATIDSVNGFLYKMPANANVEAFTFEIFEASSVVDVIVAQRYPPYAKETSCKSYQTPTGVCEVSSKIYDGTYPDWYVLISGEVGTSFTLRVVPK